jgi:hypothetical protein
MPVGSHQPTLGAQDRQLKRRCHRPFLSRNEHTSGWNTEWDISGKIAKGASPFSRPMVRLGRCNLVPPAPGTGTTTTSDRLPVLLGLYALNVTLRLGEEI